MREPLVPHGYNGDVKCKSDPYVEDVSYECALWYAERNDQHLFKYVSGDEIRRWEKMKKEERERPVIYNDYKWTYDCDPRNYCLACKTESSFGRATVSLFIMER